MQQEQSLGAVELTKVMVNRDMYRMMIKQQPSEGQVLAPQKRASAKKPQNDKVSLDPPIVIELLVIDDDPTRSWLHSPYLFCTAELVRVDDKPNRSDTLSGTLTSSLHVVKMNDGKGKFFLRFTLFEMRRSQDAMFAEMLNSVSGATFEVYARNKFSPLPQSTDLTRALSEGGVKVRVRKEPTRRLQRNKTNWGFQGYLGGYGQAVPASVYGQPQPYLHHGLQWSQHGNATYNTNNAVDIRDRISVQHHVSAPQWNSGVHQHAAVPMGPPIPPQPQPQQQPQSQPQPLHRLEHGAFFHDMRQQPVNQLLPHPQAPLGPLLLHETQHALMLPPPVPSPQNQQQPSFSPLPQILGQDFPPLHPAGYTARDDGQSQLEYSTAVENQNFYATSDNPMPQFTVAGDQVAYTSSAGAQLMYSTALEDQMVPTTSPGTNSTRAASSSSVDQQQYQQSVPHVPGTYHDPGFDNLHDTYDPSSSLGGFL
ncbi:hypothetical protein CLAIMM_11670 [Cladophialophora immunda]|nr:hypothetical protein CLAIMM_11670 [Cladophialophora immunda]